MTRSSLLDAVQQYYAHTLEKFGPEPSGVDWNSLESQALRFKQLARLFEGQNDFSINDYGCGYSALIPYLLERGFRFEYFGFDICTPMIESGAGLHGKFPFCRFSSDEAQIPQADYTVASGIFNVKFDFDEGIWEQHVFDTLGKMHSVSKMGFAFNVLTSYSDAHLRRRDLYYADPLKMFAYCREHFSRFVALLHDYPLFEFTILVRN